VVTRALSLAVEFCLLAASLVAFGALLVPGSRAGRVAFRAMVWGAAAALLASLATIVLGLDVVWLMDAWRVDVTSQAVKAVITAGLLGSVLATRQDSDEWHHVRAVGPFFRLACATALAAAASAGDLLVLWLTLDLGTAALVMAVAVGGGWSARERVVRRLVQSWLPSSVLLLLGVILLGAVAGTTRFVDLEAILPELRASPVVQLGLALVLGSIVIRALRCVALLMPAGPRLTVDG
jgi:formate hydrogenlyase subunit 3/multisubunit Na+/H+ antiporter MnhD subunit